jgi:hypothetical protein
VRPSTLPAITSETGGSSVSQVHFCQWAKVSSGCDGSGLPIAAIISCIVGVGFDSRNSRTAAIRCSGTSVGAGRPVFAATTRAKRSGFSATMRRPINPPQSWHTRFAARTSFWTSHAVSQSTWRW